jgi:hypothetical protein
MSKKLTLLSAVLAGAFVIGGSAQAAPLVLEGNFVKVGVNDFGTFGSGGSVSPGILHDPSGTGAFGINDYLTPGTPHDGFGIKSTETGFIQNDNSFGDGGFGTAAPTLLVGPAALGYANAATWSGGNSNLTITNSYFFNANDERVLVNTTITAVTGLTNLKFVRSEDPDPDVNAHGTFVTKNQRGNTLFAPSDFIGSAGDVSGLFLGFLNNSGSTYAHNTLISGSCCSTQDPDDVLAGGGATFPGAPDVGDFGLNMAWLIGDLAAGDSATISYYYVFGDNIDTGGGDKVPEPGMLSLLGLALAGTAVARRRKTA